MTPAEAARIVAALLRNVEMDAARAGALARVADDSLAEVAAALRLALETLEAEAKETVRP